MEDSIFLTIKSLLGYESFGVEGFSIEDDTATWEDFLEGSNVSLNEVKTYIYLRVRRVFDPPASSILSAAFDKQIDELGWRMTTKVECSAEA